MTDPRYAAAVAKIGREAFDAELVAFREWQRTVRAIRDAELTARAVAAAARQGRLQ